MAHNLVRHITSVSAQLLVDEEAKATSVPPATSPTLPYGPPGTFTVPYASMDVPHVQRVESTSVFPKNSLLGDASSGTWDALARSPGYHSKRSPPPPNQGFRFPSGSASDFQPGPIQVCPGWPRPPDSQPVHKTGLQEHRGINELASDFLERHFPKVDSQPVLGSVQVFFSSNQEPKPSPQDLMGEIR